MKIFKKVIKYFGYFILIILAFHYLSVTFSPDIVEREIDESIFEAKGVEIDSTVNGSELLKKLELLSDQDFTYLNKVFFKRNYWSTRIDSMIKIREEKFLKLSDATYFDKKDLKLQDKNNTELYKIEYSKVIGQDIRLEILKIKFLFRENRLKEATELFAKILKISKAMGDSNLNLVGSMTSSAASLWLNKDIRYDILKNSDTLLLNNFRNILYRNKPNQNWTLNSMRSERIGMIQSIVNIDLKGFKYLPDFILHKWLNPEGFKKIEYAKWSNILKFYQNIESNNKLDTLYIPEYDKLKKMSSFEKFMRKNTAVLFNSYDMSNVIKYYQNYVLSNINDLKFTELIIKAIDIRLYELKYNKLPNSLTEIKNDIYKLRYEDKFIYEFENKILKINALKYGRKEFFSIQLDGIPKRYLIDVVKDATKNEDISYIMDNTISTEQIVEQKEEDFDIFLNNLKNKKFYFIKQNKLFLFTEKEIKTDTQNKTINKSNNFDKQISFTLLNQNLYDIMNQIKKLSDINFIISDNTISQKRFSISLQNIPVIDLLNFISNSLNTNYYIKKNVLIFAKESNIQNFFKNIVQREKLSKEFKTKVILTVENKKPLELYKMIAELAKKQIKFPKDFSPKTITLSVENIELLDFLDMICLATGNYYKINENNIEIL